MYLSGTILELLLNKKAQTVINKQITLFKCDCDRTAYKYKIQQ